MNTNLKKRIRYVKSRSRLEKDRMDYLKSVKSIENDDEFIKLYNMTVQKYLDEDLDPNTITFSQIIELDFDYFARTYGSKCFVVKNVDGIVDFYDI